MRSGLRFSAGDGARSGPEDEAPRTSADYTRQSSRRMARKYRAKKGSCGPCGGCQSPIVSAHANEKPFCRSLVVSQLCTHDVGNCTDKLTGKRQGGIVDLRSN